ncbi:MAG: hypothetical protein Q8930_04410 [Bacillota bacterium]|nr:hypothetical protein [Bacillota bacterium]
MFRLGLDIDGCINDFSSLIYRYASFFSESHGIIKEIDMSDYLIERYFGWSEYMNNEFWTKNYKHALTNTVPLPCAVEVISRLKGENVEIDIITARREGLREITINWLNRHGIPFDKLIMSREKAKACIESRIDLMIEDEPENCEAISEHTTVLCMAYKYNERLEGSNNLIRVSSWMEIYSEVIERIRAAQTV